MKTDDSPYMFTEAVQNENTTNETKATSKYRDSLYRHIVVSKVMTIKRGQVCLYREENTRLHKHADHVQM